MARRKKKQKQPVRTTQKAADPAIKPESPAIRPEYTEVAGGEAGASQPTQTRIHLDKKTARAQQAQGKTRATGVAISTCIAGMFLTLVLGLYLGTLMPGVIEDVRQETKPTPQAKVGAREADRQDSDLARMVAALEQKVAANPDSAPDWINLGNIYFDAMQPARAITAYERALQLAPKNADVLTDLGIMYRETGQFEKAIATFEKAMEVNPQHENAMFNAGVVLGLDLGKKTEAVAIWRKLLERNPGAHAPNGEPLAKMIENLQ